MLVANNVSSQGDNGVLRRLNVPQQVEGDVLGDLERPTAGGG